MNNFLIKNKIIGVIQEKVSWRKCCVKQTLKTIKYSNSKQKFVGKIILYYSGSSGTPSTHQQVRDQASTKSKKEKFYTSKL